MFSGEVAIIVEAVSSATAVVKLWASEDCNPEIRTIADVTEDVSTKLSQRKSIGCLGTIELTSGNTHHDVGTEIVKGTDKALVELRWITGCLRQPCPASLRSGAASWHCSSSDIHLVGARIKEVIDYPDRL